MTLAATRIDLDLDADHAPQPPAIRGVPELLALFTDPADAGRRAIDERTQAFGRRISIRPAPPLPTTTTPPRALILRGTQTIDPAHPPGPDVPVPPDMPPGPGPDVPDDPTAPHPDAPAWPDPHALSPGDRLLLRVDPTDLPAYCAWLIAAAAHLPRDSSLAPYTAIPGGLHRLHLLAAARLALPRHIRVEARHDLIGIRLAQVALQFGADTLAGPIDTSRHLPLAAVPRPNETSRAALAELIRQAGLEPDTTP